ncbi:ribosome maturation factor RimP [Nocardioides marmoribigeumensis]|uniref:Ribosome maturation factor RimP n=1 Tax=Nocardioides marmoribigeumensis TaxID=433649 RepID=A0ABU2BRY3_9ACTN|nr:ribosome maturation factor RimP [Nocardioides marmoribigeumensis]MDR7361403.1 ribosome maturation factor RimP [Nocardioides marmoribigeumensis]
MVDRTREQLVEELTGPLLASGFDLEAVEVTPAGRRRLLRIAVDKDGGVTMDEIALVTKQVSALLDSSDVMGEQPYTLEVTSPGVDRPLTLPRHWRRNAGRLVKVSLKDGGTLTGRIVDGDEDHAEVETDEGVQPLSYAEVTTARIQVEFNRKEG